MFNSLLYLCIDIFNNVKLLSYIFYYLTHCTSQFNHITTSLYQLNANIYMLKRATICRYFHTETVILCIVCFSADFHFNRQFRLFQLLVPDPVGGGLPRVGPANSHCAAGHNGHCEDGEHGQYDGHAHRDSGPHEGGAVLLGAVGRHRMVSTRLRPGSGHDATL